MFEIETIKHEDAIQIIETQKPIGLFITKDGDKYIAIDNSEGHAWTEEFRSLYVADCWLTGDIESTFEAYETDRAITRLASILRWHPWYENETIERCREMAEHTIMNLRKGAK